MEDLLTFLELLEPKFESYEFYWSGLHPDGKRLQAYGTIEEMLPRLAERNQQGYSIFTCINGIDTPVYEDGKPKRRAKDITRVRAVFADWDNPTRTPPETFPLEPSLIVQTSLNKFHIYWLVDDLPLDTFANVQRSIAATLGTDPSVVDLSREMRLPGFNHTKDPHNPSPVTLVHHTGNRYSAAQILAAFPAKAAVPKFSTWDGDTRASARFTAAFVERFYGDGRRADGGFNVPCPWMYEHTTVGNPSETTYFPPAELNSGQGMFKCMHAHCARRFAQEYDEWIAGRIAIALGGK